AERYPMDTLIRDVKKKGGDDDGGDDDGGGGAAGGGGGGGAARPSPAWGAGGRRRGRGDAARPHAEALAARGWRGLRAQAERALHLGQRLRAGVAAGQLGVQRHEARPCTGRGETDTQGT